MDTKLSIATIVGIAKQVMIRDRNGDSTISSILYKYDEKKDISTGEQNALLVYIHEGTKEWEKPKSMKGMLDEMAAKIGYDRKRGYSSTNGVADRADVAAIYAWVMNPKRK